MTEEKEEKEKAEVLAEATEIVEAEVEDKQPDVVPDDPNSLFIEGLNDKITSMVEDALGLITEDRSRAEEILGELREFVLDGETDPDVLRELNKAQENISSTTDQVIKVLAQLAKVRAGDTRIQIAQINEAKKALGEDGNKITGTSILKALEEMEKEGNKDTEDVSGD